MKKTRTSFWLCAFICASSFAGSGWCKENEPYQSKDFASKEDEKVIKKLNQLNQAVSKMTPAADDMTCTCQLGDQTNILTFETPESCGPDRTYLQNKFLAFKKEDPKGLFSAGRDYSKTASILPRKCALFIMRKFWKDRALSPQEKLDADIEYNRTAPEKEKRPVKTLAEYKQDPSIFSKCDKDPNGVPERYGYKACVTEDYVNLVYNSLIDVSDCLNVPPKFIAPKLSNESGLHVNAFGLVNDGGIGQFTNQALEDVKQNFPDFKSRIMGSSKESCKRLRSFPGVIPSSSKEILSADENRCHAITTPPNPLRSLIYYGIFFHATKRNADGAYNKSKDSKDDNFKSIEALMKEAKISDFDSKKIQDMLFVMAYNAGPGRPATIYREWLKYRIDTLKKYPIKKADFDMNYWPEADQIKEKAGEARAKLVKKGDKPLTFAEYLFAYKDSLYIALVKAQARKLDKGLGAGTCTEAKFLEL